MKYLAIFLLLSSVAYADHNKYLKAHNAVRAKKKVPPLVWDLELAGFAQKWVNHLAKNCTLVHSTDNSLGENLAQTWGSASRTPQAIVDMWASEEKYYNYKQNTCLPGKVCGHYTQLVWSETKKLGCAKATCLNTGEYKNITIYACEYSPAGNFRGHWPY